MKIKVCGMKHNIDEVARLKPDYMGFIFWNGSSRYFTGTPPALPEAIYKVGVFVNAGIEDIKRISKLYGLWAIQLHGEESPDFCRDLRTALLNDNNKGEQVKIIKAFSVKDHFNFNTLEPFEDSCDFFLFDTKGKLPGGNGYSFDWQLLQGYPSQKEYFLSGGIGPEDISRLKEFFKTPESGCCHAIDVNSRFETEPGRKKTKSLSAFMDEIR